MPTQIRNVSNFQIKNWHLILFLFYSFIYSIKPFKISTLTLNWKQPRSSDRENPIFDFLDLKLKKNQSLIRNWILESIAKQQKWQNKEHKLVLHIMKLKIIIMFVNSAKHPHPNLKTKFTTTRTDMISWISRFYQNTVYES